MNWAIKIIKSSTHLISLFLVISKVSERSNKNKPDKLFKSYNDTIWY